MWKLKKLNDDKILYLIPEKHSYTVGRKNCDIVIEEDTSISRKHCTIYIAKKDNCNFEVNTLTGVWIVDEQSKYGTYLKVDNDWVKLNPKEEKILVDKTIIKFGLLESIWSLEYGRIIACTSGIPNEGKMIIQAILQSIDGELKHAWSNDCTLVIVNEITLTVKVVLALINGIPIVTLEYVKKLLESIKDNIPLPDVKNYRPVIKEAALDVSLVSLDPTHTRKELFKGLTFIFPTRKQHETLREVILNAGGKANLLSLSGNFDKLGYPDIVVIQLPSNKSNLSEELLIKFQQIEDLLKQKYKKRIIPESEIAKAIAYSSIEKLCNTMNNTSNFTLDTTERDMGVVLVEETPDIMEERIITEPCVIPSSLAEELDNSFNFHPFGTQSGRKRTLLSDESGPSKKISKDDGLDYFNCENPNTEQSNSNKETKSKSIKNNQSILDEKSNVKDSVITTYFKKREEQTEKNILQEERSNRNVEMPDEQNSDFFSNENTSGTNKNCNKRKLIQADVVFTESNTISKKAKPIENFAAETPEKPVSKLLTNEKIFSVIQDEDDLIEGFIEKDKSEIFSQLKFKDPNNTIFDINLISQIYLKEDGSLIDPPKVPVNVKKFKKQKIISVDNVHFDLVHDNDDELSGGGWLEPHPLNISDISINEKYGW